MKKAEIIEALNSEFKLGLVDGPEITYESLKALQSKLEAADELSAKVIELEKANKEHEETINELSGSLKEVSEKLANAEKTNSTLVKEAKLENIFEAKGVKYKLVRKFRVPQKWKVPGNVVTLAFLQENEGRVAKLADAFPEHLKAIS
jgi:cell division septum initiation protein DivIVA